MNAVLNVENLPEHSAGIRTEREVLKNTRAFASESAAKSRWHVISTFTLMVTLLAAAGLLDEWPLRAACSVLGSLVMVRAFITYHDFMHGSLLRGSKTASVFFHVYGSLGLTPRRSWKKSHNYHHGHVGQLSTSGIGAFPIMSIAMWRKASQAERLRYRANRHPLIVLFGYVTIFAFSICLLPLLHDPRRHWDSAVALLSHGATQLQAHVRLDTGGVVLLSIRARVLELPAARQALAMVHREHRLSPHPSPERGHSFLSPPGSDGRHTRAPGARHDVAGAA